MFLRHLTSVIRPNATRTLSPARVWLARGIAMAADAVQVGLFPVFAEGFVTGADAVLDVLVAITLVLLVGWHIAFVPSFIIEMLPVADLAPTWTIAAFLATGGRAASQVPHAIKPESQA